jgi:ABC-type multidrug transport system permease subunit
MSLLQAAFSINNPGMFELGDDAVVGFFKLLFVILGFLYVIFAFVVTRQIKVMRTTLITPVSPVVRLIGYLHFFVALAVFLGLVLFL